MLLSIAAVSMPVFGSTVLGDTSVEPVASTLNAQYVEALTKITVNQSTVIHSVSMYLQYNGSDGSQCLKFGVYGDNGGSPYGQSSPMNEPLIASTKNGYCFVVGNFGPGWETWALQPSDYITIPAGVYWLAVLPEQSYGLIYHFTYTGIYPGQYLYNYGYFMYGFPASYALGFPPTVFGATPYGYGGYLILPFNSGNVGEYNAPYSFYVTGT
ncbi:MAG: hypothetical protein ABSF63_00875 [Candidatus Bathyarchaeia archaeon]|jgi:hypothetical protein